MDISILVNNNKIVQEIAAEKKKAAAKYKKHRMEHLEHYRAMARARYANRPKQNTGYLCAYTVHLPDKRGV